MYLASLNVNGRVEANLSRVGIASGPPLVEVPCNSTSMSQLEQVVQSCAKLAADDAAPLATTIQDLSSLSGFAGSPLSVVCL